MLPLPATVLLPSHCDADNCCADPYFQCLSASWLKWSSYAICWRGRPSPKLSFIQRNRTCSLPSVVKQNCEWNKSGHTRLGAKSDSPPAEACTSDLASEMSIDGYPASQELHMESRNLQLFNHEKCLYFWCWNAAFPCKLTLLVESLTTFCHIQASYLTTTSDFFQAGCVTWGAISQKEHANKNWEIKI